MSIPHDTVTWMAVEGITTINNLGDFDKDSLSQMADNLRRPGGRDEDLDNEDLTIPTPGFTFDAESQKRLLVATDLPSKVLQGCGKS